jgi:hypothetical protein
MKGLSLRRIPEGKPGAGIKVVRLHYSADPTMTPARVAALKTEYPDTATWNREMEIDPNARSGQKVFPGFDEGIHVVDHFLPLKADDWTVWLACDPHPRRAHAFVWLAVNRYGDMVIPWSWWPEEINKEREKDNENRLLIREYVEAVREVEKSGFFPPSFMDLMDQAGKNFNSDEEHNFFDAYEADGAVFTPAKKNRGYAGYNLINDALTPKRYIVGSEEHFKPRLTIMRGCGHNHILVQQFRNLRFRKLKGDVEEKVAPPEPIDKDRHLIDCVSYILLDGPMFIDRSRRPPDFAPTYPSLGY